MEKKNVKTLWYYKIIANKILVRFYYANIIH